jgi:hypothetical protein
MSTVKHALREVGYEVKKPKTLENVVVEIFQEVERDPRLQVQRAGGHYKARWEGQQGFCFGTSVEEATSRLKFAGFRPRQSNKKNLGRA